MKTDIKSIIAWILLSFLLQGYSIRKSIQAKKTQTSESTYEIERFKTWDGNGQILNIQLFDFKDKTKRYPFRFAFVNGIAIKDSLVMVAADTETVSIELSQILKHSVKVQGLQLTKGDSLVVKAYLKDSNTIFD